MTKPTETRKWTQDDIDDVKQALPDGVTFGTLTGYPEESLKLRLDGGIDPHAVGDTADEVADALRDIDIPVTDTSLTTGFFGRNTPDIALHAKWDGD